MRARLVEVILEAMATESAEQSRQFGNLDLKDGGRDGGTAPAGVHTALRANVRRFRTSVALGCLKLGLQVPVVQDGAQAGSSAA